MFYTAAPFSPIRFSTIKLRFDGPFSFVFKTGKHKYITGVTAFVPRDHMLDKMHPRHLFYLDRTYLGTDDGQNSFSFDLTPGTRDAGFEVCTAPRHTEEGFKDFNDHTDVYTEKPYFVRVDLPCPDRILHSLGTGVTFVSMSRYGYMPLNHILEYQLVHPNAGVKLRNGRLGDLWLAPESDTFYFQVGLPLVKGSGTAHALHFFNSVTLPCFPKLTHKELLSIEDPGLHLLGADVECKSGGIMGTIP